VGQGYSCFVLYLGHELSSIFGEVLLRRGNKLEERQANEIHFEHLFAGLIARTDFSDLTDLEFMPGLLDQQGLDLVADSLLFVLGYEERLVELAKSLGISAQEMASGWFHMQKKQVVAERPELANLQHVDFFSTVLGCNICVTCDNRPQCIAIAESLLAALESTLATASLHRIFAKEATLKIKVVEHSLAVFPFSINTVEDLGVPKLEISCQTFDPHNVSVENHKKILNALFEGTVTALGAIVSAGDLESSLQALFKEESAHERAQSFTSTFGFQANLLGFNPKITLQDWKSATLKNYPIQRTEAWIANIDEYQSAENTELIASNENHTPPKLTAFDEQPHDQMRVESLIRISLWEQAGWSGTAFITVSDGITPPTLGFVFRDRASARQIFQGWRQTLGESDSEGKLRISIVRSINRQHPHNYRVVITSNLKPISSQQHVTVVSRINEMTPSSSYNLDNFLENQKEVGAFLLVPAFIKTTPAQAQSLEIDQEFALKLQTLIVREAWTVGPHDLECVAINDDDDISAPSTELDLPYKKLLAERQKRSLTKHKS
jgi:hypothetical protein